MGKGRHVAKTKATMMSLAHKAAMVELMFMGAAMYAYFSLHHRLCLSLQTPCVVSHGVKPGTVAVQILF
jgi:hypothetical protein